MRALGQPTDNAKRFGEKYFAYVDVFHQLHCLDLVRKYRYRDYYPDYIAFQDDEDVITYHVGKFSSSLGSSGERGRLDT